MEKLDDRTKILEKEKSDAEEADRLRFEGNESFRENDFEKAVELYTKSLLAKKTVPALLNRSFSYVKMQRFAEALLDADEALLLEPDNLKGKCRRGIALRELGQYSLALKEFCDCLEHDSQSANFQKLYDHCQMLSDQKMFVNLRLEIVGYNDPKHAGEVELDLLDLDRFPCSPHINHPTIRFQSLAYLEAYIKENVKGALDTIRIENSVVDEQLMKFFRSLDPLALAPCNVEFYNVGCSSDHFAELFGGRLFRPLGIWFSRMERTEYDMSTAFRSLAAVSNAISVQLGAIRFDHFLEKNEHKGCVDLDAVLDLLHQPHPDIPPHIRASTTFFWPSSPLMSNVILAADMTADKGVTMFRCMAGRLYLIDLNHFNHAGTDAKLAEAIHKCTQRFRSANTPVSYALQVRFIMPEPNTNPLDFVSLAQISQRTVIHNGCGEKLTMAITLKQFEQQQLPNDPNGEVVLLNIERTRIASGN